MGSNVIYLIGLFAVVFSFYIRRGGQPLNDHGRIAGSKTIKEGTDAVSTSPNTTLPIRKPSVNSTRRHWCPKAHCRQQRLCDTCSRRFLIVIAQGRSASTSLIEMLDLLPNVRMGGENDRLITRFYEVKLALDKTPYNWDNRGSAWKHNPVEPEDWVCAGQTLMETIYPPKKGESDDNVILGFKTIRFAVSENVYFNVTRNVDIYKTMFPCARFLFNIRSDVSALASSRQKAFSGGDVEALENNSKREILMLQQAANLFGEQAFVLDSSKWTKNITRLNDAVSWLGFHDTCHFDSLLEFNTAGSYGYTASKSHLDGRDPRCRFVGHESKFHNR